MRNSFAKKTESRKVGKSESLEFTDQKPNLTIMSFKFEKLIVWQKSLGLSTLVNGATKRLVRCI